MVKNVSTFADPARLCTPNVIVRADHLMEGDTIIVNDVLTQRPVIVCVDRVRLAGDDIILDFTSGLVGETTTSMGNTFIVLANARLGHDLTIRA